MAQVPRYKTAATRPVAGTSGFIRNSNNEVWAAGVTARDLRAMLLLSDPTAEIEVSELPEARQEEARRSKSWRTITDRPLKGEQLETAIRKGLAMARGKGVSKLLDNAAETFQVLRRVSIAKVFVDWEDAP